MAFLKTLKSLSVDDLMCKPITPFEELQAKAGESMRHRMELTLMYMQAQMCRKFDDFEKSPFKVERDVSEHCSDVTCTIENGEVFERASVLFMTLNGKLDVEAAKELAPGFEHKLKNASLNAMVLEYLIHPRNPHVPALSGSYRYIEATTTKGKKMSWLSGGHNLQPVFIVEEDIVHFHQTIKDACDKHNPDYYQQYKEACDEFFHNSIRDECIGVGGIFFELNAAANQEGCYSFLVDCIKSVIPCYMPIVEKRVKDAYTDKQRKWLEIRRGRLVEFHLSSDRGTKFGMLFPDLHIENMFLTLPPNACWKFKYEPLPGSEERKFLQVLKNPRDWV